jgi:hypothetical protein
LHRIRINDLARELGLKSKRVLGALPLVDVACDKNHSSGLNEDEADRLRAYFRPHADEPSAATAELVPIRLPGVVNSSEPSLPSISANGVLRPFTRHVKRAITICPFCGARLRGDRLQGHLTKRCPSRGARNVNRELAGTVAGTGGRDKATAGFSSSPAEFGKKRHKNRKKKRSRKKKVKTSRVEGANKVGWVSFVSGGRPGSNRRH